MRITMPLNTYTHRAYATVIPEQPIFRTNVEIVRAHFEANVEAERGAEIECCVCLADFKKKRVDQKFCNIKYSGKSNCKDYFYNHISAKKRKRYPV